ncbi:bifunctional 2-C-methyl-D-erythritol 4-phosphate cytidylyltransferase/2-C-methyl-D-erythritol 2,4-cyclodiphosphate synthase [Chthonobacter rhizosphaerae]|uniref:bifunctional 2-C-methyl-D-erythritol 4-phosphate cytidylyltransferase/2-C-methyl-D-erythritol 2,4-cyclodiphosphate synthase n=1 Tax=Chthonobacter rhizosphaerae TaxID=2735553 RepID=UPI001FEC8DCC|nr:bifunctional 2-C-methyl-D-erythritol 4-phosphate cytidylyltransferase/2-C-methyl-D-erythritol 2,4-cyclodiphosphate synthase [Chthonobacter rhizosphaerae]
MSDSNSLAPAAMNVNVAVLLVAAGRGSRAGGPDAGGPKQYRALAGKPVLRHTVEAFLHHPVVTRIVTVIHPDDADLAAACLADVAAGRALPPVTGGRTRQESVRRGLEALAGDPPDLVLVHDGVRPFVTGGTIDACVDALGRHEAVVVGVPVVDTVKRTGPDGRILETVPREGLWRAATPQGFRFATILDAHRRAAAAGVSDLTDDGAVAEWAGHAVHMVACDEGNTKLTTQSDFAAAEARLTAETFLRLPDVRVGVGYDVHRFEEGDAVVLGGVTIPHSHKLNGHSDADVALHALVDAILGAIGDGDIGQHFPPSDPRWRGAASTLFLEDAVRRVRERGGIVAHCDIAILAEAPKVGPHRDAMRAIIAGVCGIPVERVGVKATTNEKMGFVGRREGIAAMATATVRLPVAP